MPAGFVDRQLSQAFCIVFSKGSSVRQQHFPLIQAYHIVIMKGTVFNIRSFSVHDGPGIRLTVFLKGCPLNCFWCHNPESRSPEKEVVKSSQKVGDRCFEVDETIGYEMYASEILERALADKAFFEESGGGITLSGGEPMFQHQFVAEILQLCKKHDIHTALDTSGFAPTQFSSRCYPIPIFSCST